MDPLTSHSSTRGRGRTRRARRASFTTSPPVRRLSAIARRRSIREPRPRTHRRVRRSPGFQTRRDRAAPASAISSARERGEVLVGEAAEVAPGLQAACRRRRVAFCLVGAGRRCRTHRARGPPRSRPQRRATRRAAGRVGPLPRGVRARRPRTPGRRSRSVPGDGRAAHGTCDTPRRVRRGSHVRAPR